MKRLYFGEIDSTNTYAKTLLSTGEDALIVAKRQTGGRGTKGRSFCSDEGGVYLTKLSFYDAFPAKNAFLIMAVAATAVCKTLEHFGLSPRIKWPNDVFVGGKKICGILIENVFSGDKVRCSIVGVGLNVNNPLREEIKDIAVTMAQALGKQLCVDEVTECLIGFLHAPFDMDEYRKRVGYLSVPVTLVEGETATQVIALEVNEKGELIVEQNGRKKAVRSGEVSLRI